MLTIRLSRVGKTKQPSYRLIVSEKTKDPWGRYLENLGFYNPRANPPTIQFKTERIKHWLAKGAQVSDTVNNLLISRGIREGAKRKKVHLSKKRAARLDSARQAKLAEKKTKETKAAAAPAPLAPAPETPAAAPA